MWLQEFFLKNEGQRFSLVGLVTTWNFKVPMKAHKAETSTSAYDKIQSCSHIIKELNICVDNSLSQFTVLVKSPCCSLKPPIVTKFDSELLFRFQPDHFSGIFHGLYNLGVQPPTI